MSKFRVGETYDNKSGGRVRIICDDAGIVSSGSKVCNFVGVVTGKAARNPGNVLCFDDDGNYAGNTAPSYALYSLISNEPSEEELALIESLNALASGSISERDRQAEMLKVIRQLRHEKK
jgi:hypothetical protein